MALSKLIEAEKVDSFYSVSDPYPEHAPQFRRRHPFVPSDSFPSVACPARASEPCGGPRGLPLPGQPPPLLHAQPPSRCLFQITKVDGSHMRKGPLPVCEARLQHSTGALDREAGSLRHLVGKTHPARRVRLGPALLGPSMVLPSYSESAPVSTCPASLHPLPSHTVSSHLPRLQQL